MRFASDGPSGEPGVGRRWIDSPEVVDPAVAAAHGLTARTPISAAEQSLGIEPVLVDPGDPLDIVITRAGASPATRVLGVIDAAGVLIGVVTSRDLVAAIVGRLAPGALLADVHDVDGMAQYDRYVEARVAADLMREPAAIRSTATLGEAFRLMQERHLSGVYLVDPDGRPVGYVDGLELAAAILAAG